MNYGILVPLVIGIGGTHELVDGKYAQVIQNAYPEMRVEGAHRREINQALVVEAMSVMDTFQVRIDETVLNFACIQQQTAVVA